MRGSLQQLLSVSIAASLYACGGDGPAMMVPQPPAPPVAITRLTTGALSGQVGEQLAEPLRVRVTNASGGGVSGVDVDFRVTAGGGALTAASVAAAGATASLTGAVARVPVTTGTNGEASVTWTFGTQAGLQSVTANVTGLESVVFSATVAAGPPATVRATSGFGSVAQFGQPLPQPPTYTVQDEFGNLTSGGSVTWEVIIGDGTLSQTTTSAGEDGRIVAPYMAVSETWNGLTGTAEGMTPDTFFVLAFSTPGSAAFDPVGDAAVSADPNVTFPDGRVLGVTIQSDFLIFYARFVDSVATIVLDTVETMLPDTIVIDTIPPNAIIGFIDIDRGVVSTGITALSDALNAQTGMEVDLWISLDTSDPDLLNFDSLPAGAIDAVRIDSVAADGGLFGAILATVPLVIDNVFIVGIPLDFLNADGSIQISAALASPLPPTLTDAVPSTGSLTFNTAVAGQAALGPDRLGELFVHRLRAGSIRLRAAGRGRPEP